MFFRKPEAKPSDFTARKEWFESHVTLFGKPYTLDDDQARAVFDEHKNTIVTARAGSGKTRVIVAKIAYLVASKQAKISEIAAFMFNRTAAAEVNERIGAVQIDGISLKNLNQGKEIKIASTFHKFALDIVKLSGESPQLISETEHETLVKQSVRKVVAEFHRKFSSQEYAEVLRLANSFIARAGQKYLGEKGLTSLCRDVDKYIEKYQANSNYQQNIFLHRLCLAAYQEYLLALNFPKLDFNILMARAIRILRGNVASANPKLQKVARYKYLMVDEYQDFSYLFFSLIGAIRENCPASHLFVVGDDWQAINRFAGSDVNYFINFAEYFSEDVANIPLNTNYRSARKIVENANRYMLKNYNPKADKAVPFSKKNGKVVRMNPYRTRFDTTDLQEDALGDARYQMALAQSCTDSKLRQNPRNFTAAAQLLKTAVKIIKHHRKSQIMLLHRHNFTSCVGVTLESFLQALELILTEQSIMTAADFQERVRGMTMHKSKGLEAEVVILLEVDREIVLSKHPQSTLFELFGDDSAAERADQQRLLYVAMTRAKSKLYILGRDRKCPI